MIEKERLKERLKEMKEDAEIMLIRMDYNPELKKVYADVNFHHLIEDINARLRKLENKTNKSETSEKEDFFELTPEELEEIAFMFS